MARRLGIRTLRELAHRICRLVALFTPLIVATFPTNVALIVAMETMNAACGTFVERADEVLDVEGG